MDKKIIQENIDSQSLDQLRKNYLARKAEERRRDFEFAETQLFLSQQQNWDDINFIMEQIAEWMDGIRSKKPEKYNEDKSYKMFHDYLRAIFRIESYSRNIEVSNKKAIVEYLEQKRETEKYINLYNQERLQSIHSTAKFEKKIKALESEIEFVNKNGEKNNL